jgi:hypothetical protein
MDGLALDQALMKAVEDYDVLGVKDCLTKGANPNYVRTWDGDNTHQPTSPLRMVVFRISDNFLEDAHLIKFAEIATLLLQYGADPKPAIQLAELRYGKYDPNVIPNPFKEVLRIIEQADQ